MIQRDQPSIFGDKVIVAVSSIEDGAMSFRGYDPEVIRDNRLAFLDAAGVDSLATTLVRVTYDDTTDFTRYKIISDENLGEGIMEPEASMVADGLVATYPEQALFLPLADCVGAVLYDPVADVLMVSHLGRHSVEQHGGGKSIEYLVQEFDSNPADILVWLSPAAGKENYPLHAFEGRGLHEVITEQMVLAGVGTAHIEVSHIDTTDDDDYYSHSEFKAGNQHEDGRFAIVAMMVE